jgi:hypothetical protein
MTIICWVPDQPDLAGYNGRYPLSSRQKSIVAKNNDLNTLPKVKFDNLEIFSNKLGSFTVKTLALDSSNRLVALAAYSQFDPTLSSPSIQSQDTLKALNDFASNINATIMPMGDMRLGIKLACKFNLLDLYNMYETMKKFNLLDPSFVQGMGVVGSIVSPIIIGTVNAFKGAQRLIMEVALAARDLFNEIGNILSFLSSAALIYDIGKLTAMISRWIAKRSEISKYDRAGDYQKNAQRLAYAKKIVGYLNNLEKEGKPLPKDVQQDLIKFFSSDQKDIGSLWTVSNNLSTIAQNRTFMDKLSTAFGR